MTFKDILTKFRNESFTEKEKGTKFEKLMKSWLLSDPRYNQLKEVWLWEEFPGRKDFGGKDIGIDLVTKTELGEYWAIQCKCYAEDAVINKPAVDSFLSTSSKTFTDAETFQTVFFSHRLWISTTNHWGDNAIEAVKAQNPPVSIVNLIDLQISTVDWDKLLEGIEGKDALTKGKQLFKHQLNAISEAYTYYQDHDRGKLVMACGTGKTFTSLRMVETLCHDKGLVLFMVPSIALLGQSLNAWMADSNKPIKAVCICSDSKASRKIAQELDNAEGSTIDLALPATTSAKSVATQLNYYRQMHDGMIVVFSTYQSIDAVAEAQKQILKDTNGEFGEFDFIICDEAHRTTGVKLPDAEDESNFIKIHSNDNVRGKKRLYMTATPRLYGSSAKIKASQKDCILCSMDDESIYGKEFFRVNFSYAVQNGLLTDYKVFVLTVSEDELSDELQAKISDPTAKEYNFDDTPKLIGVINGLSKIMLGDEGKTWEADPRIMHRALAFCSKIGKDNEPGTSKNVTKVLPEISQLIDSKLNEEQRKRVVSITAKHIDGSMNTQERNDILNWLREDSDDPRECRVVTNVRCLSEGVDVPALDSVLFLSARNSQVDVVQSVGRVMRNFRKGKAGEKKYGYIIIPIVVPQGVKPEDALDDNKTFEVVWQILNALRSHDDAFNAEVNKIALNTAKSSKVVVAQVGIGTNSGVVDSNDHSDIQAITNSEVAKQLSLKFGTYQDGIYAKLVEKCGDRLYWENWAKEVGEIAQKFIERIARLVMPEKDDQPAGKYNREFETFLKGLQKNLNPSVDHGQAIEMLAQHMVSRPVFDALFADYKFVDNNAVSKSMQEMIEKLRDEAFEKDTALLEKFYESVRVNVGDIDNLEGKQTIIKNLYEKFFKGAFPKTVEQLGIVYTPVECVDFIIHSVDAILRKEFNTSLTEENVHILDPFTGTGTFITRLLQSGLIKKEDLERKYRNEIHCNELVLLAYYIADVNIESVFHSLVKREEYLPYDGICLTDTFQLNEEGDNDIFSMLFKENSERVIKQKKAPMKVILGNPPYSIGQKSINDLNGNLEYPKLETRIQNTYVHANRGSNLTRSLYDTYIKAFRWASDRLRNQNSGIIAFITNSGWIDSLSDGFRRCLQEEFTSVYVLDLKGAIRGKSKEGSRKEGQNVFDIMTGVAITFLVKNSEHTGECNIFYSCVPEYQSRAEKLDFLKDNVSILSSNLKLKKIHPNEKGDWINQRDGSFDELTSLAPEKKYDVKSHSCFTTYSLGIATNKDVFLYSSSKGILEELSSKMIDFYNHERIAFTTIPNHTIKYDPCSITWTDSFLKSLQANIVFEHKDECACISLYRPFFKQHFQYQKELIQRTYQQTKLFPTGKEDNIIICLSCLGSSKGLALSISKNIVDLHYNGDTQCFPLYYYEENKATQLSLFDSGSNEKYIRRDGITDWILKTVRTQYGSRNITKEMIFYYVYGLLHSEDYRKAFEADLKKSLPRIPIVEKLEDFIAFEKAGRKLAKLHLEYEEVEPYKGAKVEMDGEVGDAYEYYKIVDKMRFAKKTDEDKGKKVDDKSTIVYNSHITVKNIPEEAYEYVVNGKSAIEWVVERYAVTVDKKSLIKNDCNDWSREHNAPRYILDLLLSVINVSVQTVEIVKGLPKLKFE